MYDFICKSRGIQAHRERDGLIKYRSVVNMITYDQCNRSLPTQPCYISTLMLSYTQGRRRRGKLSKVVGGGTSWFVPPPPLFGRANFLISLSANILWLKTQFFQHFLGSLRSPTLIRSIQNFPNFANLNSPIIFHIFFFNCLTIYTYRYQCINCLPTYISNFQSWSLSDYAHYIKSTLCGSSGISMSFDGSTIAQFCTFNCKKNLGQDPQNPLSIQLYLIESGHNTEV